MKIKNNENVTGVYIYRNLNKGITLVALVITIIILLILAGITIAQLTGSGLFENARLAEEEYKNAQEKEDETLADYESKMEEYINNDRNNSNIDDYKENLLCEYTNMQVNNNTLIDDSGNNVSGQIVGEGIEIKTENGKSYIHLDGSSHIETPEFSTLTGNTEKTILCSFRTNNTSDYMAILELGDNDTARGGIPPMLDEGFFHFETGYNNYSYDNDNILLADNKWHFLCVTFDSYTLAIYIDNKPLYATKATLDTVIPKLYIGSTLGVQEYFTGDISDIRVYDKGLNMEEVYRVYQNVKR